MKSNSRLVISITNRCIGNSIEQEIVDDIKYALTNSLHIFSQTPNIAAIRQYCDSHAEMDGFANEELLTASIEPVYFEPTEESANAIFNTIEASDKTKLRGMVYPALKKDLSELKVSEATHYMILNIECNSNDAFCAAEPHPFYPCFYQSFRDVTTGIAYIESLLIDSAMSHFFGISDAAPQHPDKQAISQEKVRFIRDYTARATEGLNDSAKDLVKVAGSLMNNDTPYISLLSIFTVLPMDKQASLPKEKYVSIYFGDYCHLWLNFQKWYYEKHNRLLSTSTNLSSAFQNIFIHSKYKGQISPEEAIAAMKKTISNTANSNLHSNESPQQEPSVLGWTNRYAFVIVRSIPRDPDLRIQISTLFSGQLHPAKWRIIPWNRHRDYRALYDYLEFIPFMIE